MTEVTVMLTAVILRQPQVIGKVTAVSVRRLDDRVTPTAGRPAALILKILRKPTPRARRAAFP
jgi:hypothetical protein